MRKQAFTLGFWLVALVGLAGCGLTVDPEKGSLGGEYDEDEDNIDDSSNELRRRCGKARCKNGTHCEPVEVQCIKAPCPPVLECVPNDPPALSCAAVLCIEGTECIETKKGPKCVPIEPVIGCEAVLCIEGTTCIETEKGPQCVPQENPCNLVDCVPGTECRVEHGEPVCVPPTGGGQPCGKTTCGPGLECCNSSCGICTPPGFACIQIACEEPVGSTCATALCPTDTYCDDISGEAECIPLPSCDGVKCEDGTECVLVDVQCIRAPCPPQPSCEPVAADPCATVRCKKGTHCEAVDIVCITTPCNPIAQCVPDVLGTPCGPSRCKLGTVCCNESCGICAPPDGFCTEQFCGAEL